MSHAVCGIWHIILHINNNVHWTLKIHIKKCHISNEKSISLKERSLNSHISHLDIQWVETNDIKCSTWIQIHYVWFQSNLIELVWKESRSGSRTLTFGIQMTQINNIFLWFGLRLPIFKYLESETINLINLWITLWYSVKSFS